MINFEFDKYCTGCGACENVCPANAIELRNNSDGFKYPEVNSSLCTDCGICEKICPHLNKITAKNSADTYLYASRNKELKMKSASGGAFAELAISELNQGGIVCGCRWSKDLTAEHFLTDKYDELTQMQGSKYVQSEMSGVYNEILQLLKDGKQVLFSGTPCHCVAMYNMVTQLGCQEDKNNLTTVAVICHGISSPGVWESHKKWLAKENGSKLVAVNFRNKEKEGYKKSYCKYTYENGSITYTPTFLPNSKYIEATLVYNLAIRNSCNHCDCKGVNDACDIIIGDWYDEFTDDGEFGTSCIVACTEKGQAKVEKALHNLRSFDYQKVLERNGFIEKSTALGKKRDEFLDKYDVDIWNNVERFYPKKYILKKILIKSGIYFWLKKILKS